MLLLLILPFTKHRPPSRPRPRLVIDTVSIKLRFRMFH